MNKEKTLKYLEDGIRWSMDTITLAQEKERHACTKYLNGILEAHEKIKEKIESGDLD